jgi:hypothetical protein
MTAVTVATVESPARQGVVTAGTAAAAVVVAVIPARARTRASFPLYTGRAFFSQRISPLLYIYKII